MVNIILRPNRYRNREVKINPGNLEASGLKIFEFPILLDGSSDLVPPFILGVLIPIQFLKVNKKLFTKFNGHLW